MDLSGQASASLWTQTGAVHCENLGVVTVKITATVNDRIVLEQVESVAGSLDVDTNIEMSTNEERFRQKKFNDYFSCRGLKD